MSINNRIDFILYLPIDWKSYHPQIKGYFSDVPLIQELAKIPGTRIFCVNRPFTPIETSLIKRHKAINWIRGNRLEQLGENLFLFTPFSFIHDMIAVRSQFLQKMNMLVISKQINKELRSLRFNSSTRISWIYHPIQYTYYDLVNENYKIYECYEPYSLREKTEEMKMRITEYEMKILKECDLVVALCMNLCKEKKVINPNTYFLKGAVGCDYIRMGNEESICIPNDLHPIKSPRIGFIGMINERVDIQLINFLAEKHPYWSFVMVGSVNGKKQFVESAAYHKLQSFQNVYYLGPKEEEEMPAYFKFMDVCLLPYTNDEIIKYIHPYKMYKYLSFGKPVVSTYIPDVEQFSNVVRIASNYEEFSSFVEEELKNNKKDAYESRINFARQNTWKQRAEEIYNVINFTLSKNR